MTEDTLERTSISIYTTQREIVETFAAEQHRSFSNALQFIIEDWARQKRADIEAAHPQPIAA